MLFAIVAVCKQHLSGHFFLFSLHPFSGRMSYHLGCCRLWSDFVAGLAKSVNCSADTPMAGKGTSVVIPGGKLLGNFGATETTALPNVSHFGQLGSTLLHAEPQKSYSIGTCNLMISAHTLKTSIRPEAEQEILYKLKSGFRQGLWPVLNLQDPVGHLEMPSRAAENASQTQLLDGLSSALTAVNSGKGSSLLQGVAYIRCTFLQPVSADICFCKQVKLLYSV